MLLIKSWLKNRISEMMEIERENNLPPHTKEFLLNVLRNAKGILSEFERWLNKVSK
jgi:hypothetical protein